MQSLAKLLIFTLLVSTAEAQKLGTADPEDVGISSDRLSRLDEVIQQAISEGQTPGAVVLVARRGKIVFRQAYGHRSLVPEKEPMTLDTIFDVASLTKVMATATSIMILVEQGKISLTDPVSEYLPAFAEHGKRGITILQLLTHYSGLRPDLDLDQNWESYETGIAKAYDEQLVAQPGEVFVYSDINYLILAEIVREVSGRHLHEFSAEQIYGPLGMDNTGFSPPPAIFHKIAPTEFREKKMLRGQVHDPTASRMGGCAGHAGLFSTVDDTAIFAQMILNGGVYDRIRVLSPLSILAMTTPKTPAEAPDWRGIGFDIRSTFSTTRGDLLPVGSFGHTGFTGTSMWIDPYNQLLIILFANRLHPDGTGNTGFLRKRVASVVAASLEEVPPLRSQYYLGY